MLVSIVYVQRWLWFPVWTHFMLLFHVAYNSIWTSPSPCYLIQTAVWADQINNLPKSGSNSCIWGEIQTGIWPCNISLLGSQNLSSSTGRERGSNSAGSVLQLPLGPPPQHLNAGTLNKNPQLNVVFIISYGHVMIVHSSSGCFSNGMSQNCFINLLYCHSIAISPSLVLFITGIWGMKRLNADGPQGAQSIVCSSQLSWCLSHRGKVTQYQPPHTHIHTPTWALSSHTHTPARCAAEPTESIFTFNVAHNTQCQGSYRNRLQPTVN